MSTATLNIKMTPRRMMKEREAAEYCGLTEKQFPSVCPVAPVQMPGGRRLWDIRDLDAWVDDLKGGAVTGDDDIVGKLVG